MQIGLRIYKSYVPQCLIQRILVPYKSAEIALHATRNVGAVLPTPCPGCSRLKDWSRWAVGLMTKYNNDNKPQTQHSDNELYLELYISQVTTFAYSSLCLCLWLCLLPSWHSVKRCTIRGQLVFIGSGQSICMSECVILSASLSSSPNQCHAIGVKPTVADVLHINRNKQFNVVFNFQLWMSCVF